MPTFMIKLNATKYLAIVIAHASKFPSEKELLKLLSDYDTALKNGDFDLSLKIEKKAKSLLLNPAFKKLESENPQLASNLYHIAGNYHFFQARTKSLNQSPDRKFLFENFRAAMNSYKKAVSLSKNNYRSAYMLGKSSVSLACGGSQFNTKPISKEIIANLETAIKLLEENREEIIRLFTKAPFELQFDIDATLNGHPAEEKFQLELNKIKEQLEKIKQMFREEL